MKSRNIPHMAHTGALIRLHVSRNHMVKILDRSISLGEKQLGA